VDGQSGDVFYCCSGGQAEDKDLMLILHLIIGAGFFPTSP
jgi:hypothetical protein